MTPADEATFIQLWQEGASSAAIAQALGCALGTVGSRASTLVRQGKIQARPRGGAYPKQRALARQEGAPAPPTTPATQVPTATAAVIFVTVPEIQEILSIVKELQTRVASLEQRRVPSALPAQPATPAPPRGRAQGRPAVDGAAVEGPDRAPQGRSV